MLIADNVMAGIFVAVFLSVIASAIGVFMGEDDVMRFCLGVITALLCVAIGAFLVVIP